METLRANYIYLIVTVGSDVIENAPRIDLKKQQRSISHILKKTKTILILIRWLNNC